jgi:3'(2'), 5'-bisphosphate nucleotidase
LNNKNLTFSVPSNTYDPVDNQELAAKINQSVRKAGELLVKLSQDPLMRAPESKSDGSPVTQTDQILSDLLYQELKDVAHIICEERPPHQLPSGAEDYFLIDPLDGTRYYANGEKEFAISVGLIRGGVPFYGAIYDPNENELLWALQGHGAYRGDRPLAKTSSLQKPLRIFSSGFHNHARSQSLVNELGDAIFMEKGSALKFTDLAIGQADMYIRFKPTHEWDTAAAQVILAEVGMEIWEVASMGPLLYGKPGFKNRGIFVAPSQSISQLAQMIKESIPTLGQP